jgi:polyisoprenoid-binding protein YceI
VDIAARRVEMRVQTAALRVQDPNTSAGDKTKIQETMLGADVLDAGRFPEIVFQSTSVQAEGASAWNVTGNLTLHGQTRSVMVTVREQNGRYTGTASIRQTVFGIKPVKVAGGTVKVKDDLRIEFDIRLAPE